MFDWLQYNYLQQQDWEQPMDTTFETIQEIKMEKLIQLCATKQNFFVFYRFERRFLSLVHDYLYIRFKILHNIFYDFKEKLRCPATTGVTKKINFVDYWEWLKLYLNPNDKVCPGCE